jgi:hypothetical protein
VRPTTLARANKVTSGKSVVIGAVSLEIRTLPGTPKFEIRVAGQSVVGQFDCNRNRPAADVGAPSYNVPNILHPRQG